MAQIKKGASHGLWKVLVQLTGADGISYGQAGSGLAQGSTSQAYVVEHPKTANLPQPDRTTIDFTGGDVWYMSYQYGINSLGSMSFTTQDEETDLIALSTGTLVDQTTNVEWSEFTEDVLSPSTPQVSLMFIYRMQSVEPATFGQTFYVQTVIPRAWLSPKGITGPAYQAAAEYNWQITPASSDRHVNGMDYDANLGAYQNRVALYHIISDNPLYMFVKRAVAASPTQTSMTSAFKPITSSVGTANNTKNQVALYRPSTDIVTLGVADTVVTTTGVFTIGTALSIAIDDVIIVTHETEYEAV
jgi:hypothetical protein